MLALVTGAAGFIGSTLVDALLAAGHEVRGVDCFTDYYDVARKRANVAPHADDDRFALLEADLRTADLRPLVDGADVVFHVAGQPGVRLSWSERFLDYETHNVLATQRLLEACSISAPTRFVYSSSSSVYGNRPTYPASEDALPAPHSPYGVTKLAGEHLCGLYAEIHGVPTIALRYFTVYGPRQRPDMAIYRLVEAATTGTPFPLFGDGTQVRDFTFVGDVVAANLAAADADVAPGTVVNVAGGSATSVADLIDLVGDVVGAPVVVDRRPPQAGDVERTGGAVDRAAALLEWAPSVDLRAGIADQVAWARSLSAS